MVVIRAVVAVPPPAADLVQGRGDLREVHPEVGVVVGGGDGLIQVQVHAAGLVQFAESSHHGRGRPVI